MVKITIAQNILAANDTIAGEIQQDLSARGIRTLNIMSSPGAGKTTLLERTIERLRGRLSIGVIEGDVETSADAERIDQRHQRDAIFQAKRLTDAALHSAFDTNELGRNRRAAA